MTTTLNASFASSAGVVPGPGWSGSLDDSSAVGSSGASGYSERVIGRFTSPHLMLKSADFRIGIVAFHQEGMDYVQFFVDRSPARRKNSMTLNSYNGVVEYNADFKIADFTDGTHEVRGLAWPVNGLPRALEGLTIFTNRDGTLTKTPVYVDSVNGNNSNNGDTTHPVADLDTSIVKFKAANGASAAHGRVIVRNGNYAAPTAYIASGNQILIGANTTWFTFEADSGHTNVVITSVPGDFEGQYLRLVGIKIAVGNAILNQASGYSTGWTLFENVDYTSGGYDSDNPGLFENTRWDSHGSHYYMGGSYHDTSVGVSNAYLAVGVAVSNIGEHAFKGCQAVIHCTVNTITEFIHASGPSAGQSTHGDVIEYNNSGVLNNTVFYDITGTNIQGQVASIGPLTDSAWVDVNVTHSAAWLTALGSSFNWEGAVRNLYCLRVLANSQCNFRLTESGKEFVPTKCVFASCSFTQFADDDSSTPPPAGVTIR